MPSTPRGDLSFGILVADDMVKQKKGRTMESILQSLEASVDLAILRMPNANLGIVLIVVRLPKIN
jgi:hypothetical protein